MHPDALMSDLLVIPMGHKARMPSFKVCIPKGIPIIVIIRTKLATKYSMAIIKPPKINQRMLPIAFTFER